MQPFLKQDKFFIVCLDIESFNFLESKKKENLNPIHLEKKIKNSKKFGRTDHTMNFVDYEINIL